MRNILPQRRRSETFKFQFRAQRASFHVTTGYFNDNTLGELFLNTSKTGSQSEADARDFAILISLLLQHGCTLETICGALTREMDGSPSTLAGTVVDLLIEKGDGQP